MIQSNVCHHLNVFRISNIVALYSSKVIKIHPGHDLFISKIKLSPYQNCYSILKKWNPSDEALGKTNIIFTIQLAF